MSQEARVQVKEGVEGEEATREGAIKGCVDTRSITNDLASELGWGVGGGGLISKKG